MWTGQGGRDDKLADPGLLDRVLVADVDVDGGAGHSDKPALADEREGVGVGRVAFGKEDGKVNQRAASRRLRSAVLLDHAAWHGVEERKQLQHDDTTRVLPVRLNIYRDEAHLAVGEGEAEKPALRNTRTLYTSFPCRSALFHKKVVGDTPCVLFPMMQAHAKSCSSICAKSKFRRS